MSVLSRIWAALTRVGDGSLDKNIPKLKERQRAYFHVTDPEQAKIIHDWFVRRNTAKLEVEAYLRKATSVIGAETPLYKVDENGRVSSINFQYAIGFFHDGWTGIPHTNWLVPDTDEVKRDLQQLPRFPSHSEINRAIGWPEMDYHPMSSAAHIPGLGRFAISANRQTEVSVRKGEVFVSVPYPDTFEDVPDYAQRVYDWDKPAFLQLIPPEEGRKIEKSCDLALSALGRTVAKTLNFSSRMIEGRTP